MAGRHQENSKRKSGGTGKPTPGKDRSAHQAARGVKKLTVDHLTNEVPTDAYLEDMRAFVVTESDRGVVIMCSAMVEQSLEAALRHMLPHLTSEELDSWFKGHNAPFRSFDAKIRLGRGINIYDASVDVKLNLIRKLRNVFAHRSMPLDLTHEALGGLRNELLSGLGEWPNLSEREVFAGYCLSITHVLRSIERGQPLTA